MLPVHDISYSSMFAWQNANLVRWLVIKNNNLLLRTCGMIEIALHSFPFATLVFITGYVLVLVRFPTTWLPVVLASLPVLDFAPWTGQFFFDEYDALLLLTIAVVSIRQGRFAHWNRHFEWTTMSVVLVTGLLLSALLSMLIGALPFPALDINSFNNYLSPYNAFRVGKGTGFACLLVWLAAADLRQDMQRTFSRFTLGMVLGVLCASLAIVWERLSFTGLFNFDSAYRVVGLFSGMHTGGAYVEGYLVTGLPFVIWWGIHQRHWLSRTVAALIFLTGCYALLVTYARGGYLAFILSGLVMFSGLLWRNLDDFKKSYSRIALLVLIITLCGASFSYTQTPMHKRFNHLAQDRIVRVTHWHHILSIMDPGWKVAWFGQGLGRLPLLYAQRATDQTLSEYQFVQEQHNNVLQLTGGDPLYFEQIVSLNKSDQYVIRLVARNTTPVSDIYLNLCRKWMLYAEQCQWFRSTLYPGAQWQTFQYVVNMQQFSALPWYSNPTMKLSLENEVAGSTAEIASVSLQSNAGGELLRNGDFSAGSDYWFFSTDNHLPWHYKNLFLQIYFEQGWLGLLLMLALLIYSAAMLVQRRSESDFPAPLFAAALTGFLTVGLVDSLFDFPRMGMLFYLMLMLIQCQKPAAASP
jgi:hypothetical protein